MTVEEQVLLDELNAARTAVAELRKVRARDRVRDAYVSCYRYLLLYSNNANALAVMQTQIEARGTGTRADGLPKKRWLLNNDPATIVTRYLLEESGDTDAAKQRDRVRVWRATQAMTYALDHKMDVEQFKDEVTTKGITQFFRARDVHRMDSLQLSKPLTSEPEIGTVMTVKYLGNREFELLTTDPKM